MSNTRIGVMSAMRRELQEYPLRGPAGNDDAPREAILIRTREWSRPARRMF